MIWTNQFEILVCILSNKVIAIKWKPQSLRVVFGTLLLDRFVILPKTNVKKASKNIHNKRIATKIWKHINDSSKIKIVIVDVIDIWNTLMIVCIKNWCCKKHLGNQNWLLVTKTSKENKWMFSKWEHENKFF